MTHDQQAVERVRDVLDFAGDIRWREIADGSPFTSIDRQLLGDLHAQARSSGVLSAIAALEATRTADARVEENTVTINGRAYRLGSLDELKRLIQGGAKIEAVSWRTLLHGGTNG